MPTPKAQRQSEADTQSRGTQSLGVKQELEAEKRKSVERNEKKKFTEYMIDLFKLKSDNVELEKEKM